MSPTSPQSVLVRMYNVGFGDSFLLLLPTPDGVRRKVLIDCGYHMASTPSPKMKEVVERIISDCTDSDGVARLDVVIATHRHMDHVYGFSNKSWSEVEVKEVWMPWTEDPTNPDARAIREKQSKAAVKAKKKAEEQKKLSLTDAEREKIEHAMVIASNSLVNREAMLTLHEGFSKKMGFANRRYLPSKEGGETLQTDVLPGVKIHVMGPSHDPNVIGTMEDASEEYELTAESEEATGELRPPFRWAGTLTLQEFNTEYAHLEINQGVTEAIDRAGDSDAFAAAAAVDDAVNGTSLMIMFEVGGHYLLFPGDAQWGTWQQALNSNWRGLLERTTFYKVGHHGSHNATPVTFVEKVLGDNFWAMACTGPTTKWTKIIPRTKLLEKLREKSKTVVRSDIQDVTDPTTANFKREQNNAYTEIELNI
jgi:beta-lactamase superfamily II metal-dependent hydrolase